MARPGRTRLVLLLGLAVLLALPPAAEALDRSFYVDLATRILVFALAAASLDLILGYGGMVSFGHAAFVGIGAYVVGILFAHDFEGAPLLGLSGTTSAVVAWPLAVLAAAAFALVIGAVSLRTSGVFFIMITLAFAQMLFYLATSLRRYGGEDGIALWERSPVGGPLDLNDDTTFYYVVLALLLGFLFLGRRLVRSRFGRVIRGARENERRMRALGFPTYRYKLAAFVLAGAGGGLAGALLANASEFVSPAYMAWSRSGEILVMVVLGGMGTLVGPVLGAAALLLLEEVVPDLLDQLGQGWGQHWQILLGPILLLVVLYARGGLWGLIAGPRRAGGD